MDKLGIRIIGGNDFMGIMSGNTESVKNELKASIKHSKTAKSDYEYIIDNEDKFDNVKYYIYIPYKLNLDTETLEYILAHERGHIELRHLEDCHSYNVCMKDEYAADEYTMNEIGFEKTFNGLLKLDSAYKSEFGKMHGIPYLEDRLDNLLIVSGLGLDDDLNN